MNNTIKTILALCLITTSIVSVSPNMKNYRHDVKKNTRGETYYAQKTCDYIKLHRTTDENSTFITGYCKLTKTEILVSDVSNGVEPFCVIQQKGKEIESQTDWTKIDLDHSVAYSFYFDKTTLTVIVNGNDYLAAFGTFAD